MIGACQVASCITHAMNIRYYQVSLLNCCDKFGKLLLEYDGIKTVCSGSVGRALDWGLKGFFFETRPSLSSCVFYTCSVLEQDLLSAA